VLPDEVSRDLERRPEPETRQHRGRHPTRQRRPVGFQQIRTKRSATEPGKESSPRSLSERRAGERCSSRRTWGGATEMSTRRLRTIDAASAEKKLLSDNSSVSTPRRFPVSNWMRGTMKGSRTIAAINPPAGGHSDDAPLAGRVRGDADDDRVASPPKTRSRRCTGTRARAAPQGAPVATRSRSRRDVERVGDEQRARERPEQRAIQSWTFSAIGAREERRPRRSSALPRGGEPPAR